ncbi:hypothetical protein [Nocardia sp. R7R-8]|uniref:hypothetical protein n=1 Tax=Nocardia sp. R7R-8 TaxID=3459304 RepID=UPI00403E2DC7
MHQTALPSGMQSTTEPKTGVAASDGVVWAEAAGAAMTPKETAIAVAATIFVILVDIVHPLTRVKLTLTHGFHASPIGRSAPGKEMSSSPAFRNGTITGGALFGTAESNSTEKRTGGFLYAYNSRSRAP